MHILLQLGGCLKSNILEKQIRNESLTDTMLSYVSALYAICIESHTSLMSMREVNVSSPKNQKSNCSI